MASHFVGFSRGVEGEKYSDFTTGTSTSGAVTIEVRLDDASGMTPTDVKKALEAFERFFENPQQWTAAGFVITG